MNINFLKNFISKIKKWYVTLPDRKRHIELFTAALSVPMMITVILVNVYSIKSKSSDTSTTATTTPIQVVIDTPKDREITPITTLTPTLTPTPTPTSTSCKKGIGEVEILSPLEGQIITSNNLCINISTDNDYCSVSWSYKLDDGDWSSYSNSNICLYNLTSGSRTLQIKIKSTVNDETATLQRSFIYQPVTTPTVTPTTTTAPAL